MSIKVEQIMQKEIITLEEGSTVLDLKRKILLNINDCVIIVKNKKVVGIVTKSDLVKSHCEDQQVDEIMTKRVLTVHKDCEVKEAARILTANSINALPVIDDTEIICGTINLSNIVKGMVSEKEMSRLSPEKISIFLAMTESREREEFWLGKCDEYNYKGVITQVGTSADKLPLKLRESITVAAIAKGVILPENHEKQAVSCAVRDAYIQLSQLNPGLGGGFKVSAVRGDRRIAVCLYGRCGHALGNSPEQVFMGVSII
jgi:acetoin utilization protein AcuB